MMERGGLERGDGRVTDKGEGGENERERETGRFFLCLSSVYLAFHSPSFFFFGALWFFC